MKFVQFSLDKFKIARLVKSYAEVRMSCITYYNYLEDDKYKQFDVDICIPVKPL